MLELGAVGQELIGRLDVLVLGVRLVMALLEMLLLGVRLVMALLELLLLGVRLVIAMLDVLLLGVRLVMARLEPLLPVGRLELRLEITLLERIEDDAPGVALCAGTGLGACRLC